MSSDSKSDILSEQGKRKIKELIDSFSKKISSVGSLDQEPEIIRETCDREEKDSEKNQVQDNSEFQKLMFKNAKDKNNDFIVAEKKKW